MARARGDLSVISGSARRKVEGEKVIEEVRRRKAQTPAQRSSTG
jgi:hypothetical protein